MGRVRTTLAAACLALALAPAGARADLADYVDPMIGTVPPGFTVPGAAAPFGMVQNSPDTTGEFAYSGYLATDPVIRGFSLVHLSGPGVRKAGDLPFMPFTGELVPSNDQNANASTWNRATERAEAGYYSVFLDRPATKVELTASMRTAMQRYTFPPAPKAGLIVDVRRRIPGVAPEGGIEIGDDTITGFVRSNYPVYFVARFSRPFDSKGAGWVVWDTTRGERAITMRVGISFVDADGARRNLEAEAPTFDFDGMRARTRAAWNRELARIRVSGGNLLDKRSFYTALYHAQLHPNVFEDVDGRYRGMDNQIHTSDGWTQYANFSLWDTYKGQNQLLAVIQPKRYRDMLRSLLADHRESGKLPRWGEQNLDPAHMSGDPAIPMIADGVCRGVLDGDDAQALYEASVALVQRREEEMRTLGYLPLQRSSRGAGTTLEYGGADFALAMLAKALGYDADAERWAAESLRYRHLLDPQTRFIRPRNADGSWLTPFSTTEEKGFQEGNSWQYSWLAPHDARGLFDRMGGDAEVIERLDHFFTLPSEVQNRATFFGLVYRFDQYAPGNEHDLQAPWMYPFAGQPWKTGRELADLRILFRPTLDGLPGNDDLGGLSGWYVWSTLGFGPVTPGAPFYVFGSPQWDRVVIESGKKRIVVTGAGTYVRGARLGKRSLERSWFTHEELVKAGRLQLDAGSSPDESFGAENRPPSVSDARLSAFGCGSR